MGARALLKDGCSSPVKRWVLAPSLFKGALHKLPAPFHLPKPSPTYLPATSADSPPPPPYLGHGGTTHSSPKSRLKKHTWGMVASVCGLWPQYGQLETTQASTLKSGSSRTLLQFLNLPGFGGNCIRKFSCFSVRVGARCTGLPAGLP